MSRLAEALRALLEKDTEVTLTQFGPRYCFEASAKVLQEARDALKEYDENH